MTMSSLREEINGVLAIWYREFKVFQREKSRIVSSIVNPILWLLVFGGGLGSSVTIPGVDYQAFIFPGVLAQAVLFSSVFFGVYIVWDRKIDFLKEVLVAPISRASIFVGKILGGATDSMIQAVILLTLGSILGATGIVHGLHIGPVTFVLALAILLVTCVYLVSIGLIIGSVMNSPEGFQLISGFLLFPLFFMSGALFPIDRLPAWIKPFNLIDPLTYSVDALRYVVIGQSHFPIAMSIGVMAATACVAIAAGTYAFEKMKI